jgi:hypothetical protein
MQQDKVRKCIPKSDPEEAEDDPGADNGVATHNLICDINVWWFYLDPIKRQGIPLPDSSCSLGFLLFSTIDVILTVASTSVS